MNPQNDLSILEVYRLGWKKIDDYRGRSTVREWWTFFGINLGLFCLIAFGPAIIPDLPISKFWQAIIQMIFYVATFFPSLSISVRRLHDLNRHGALIFINMVPLGGLILFFLFLKNGTPGPNKYGPDPRGRNGAFEDLNILDDEM